MPAPTPPTNPPATHGKDGVIAISTSGAGTPAPMALITDWTLDMATDTVETTALGDANKTYVQGLKDIKGTFTGQFNALDDGIFEAADSTDGVQIEIWPSVNSPISFTGPAWLNVSIKGGVSAAVTVDGSFTAKGAWSRTSPVAATGATAGSPGTYTPGGAVTPANLAALSGVTASPATAWTTGQHVILGDASHAYWNATAYVAGDAP